MIEKFLKRSSWIDIIISLIFVVFGILLITKPETTMAAIAIVIGLVFISIGALKLIEYFTSETKVDTLLTMALIMTVFGVVLLFASETLMSFAKVILGCWIILSGIMDLQTVLVWKNVKSPYWTVSLVFALLMIIAGIIILVAQNLITTIIGIIIILFGILEIGDRIIFMNKIKEVEKEIKKTSKKK